MNNKWISRGEMDGTAAGSHVVDGNTSSETCRLWLDKINDCDWDGPAAPTMSEIERQYGETMTNREHLEYVQAWYDALSDEVARACSYQLAG